MNLSVQTKRIRDYRKSTDSSFLSWPQIMKCLETETEQDMLLTVYTGIVPSVVRPILSTKRIITRQNYELVFNNRHIRLVQNTNDVEL